MDLHDVSPIMTLLFVIISLLIITISTMRVFCDSLRESGSNIIYKWQKRFTSLGFELRTFRTLGINQKDFSQCLKKLNVDKASAEPPLDNLFSDGIVSVEIH